MGPTTRQFKPVPNSHPFVYKLISIMSAWVFFNVRSGLFLSECSTKMIYTVPLCSIRTICGVHFALFEVVVYPHYTITKRSEFQPKMEQFPTPAIIFQDNPRTDPLLNGKVGVLTENRSWDLPNANENRY
jgi:hypothetical protein